MARPLRFALIACCSWLLAALVVVTNKQQTLFVSSTLTNNNNNNNHLASRLKFELRFQNELDNSTLVKHTKQQQVLKCQVRLAPVGQPTAGAQSRPRPVVVLRQLGSGGDELLGNPTEKPSKSRSLASKWWSDALANVSIALEWLKDDRKLVEANVINVDLNKTAQVSATPPGARSPTNAHTKSHRIEIKNTLNSNQLKLSSRLKLSSLRASDAGFYRCQARASFSQLQGEKQREQQQVASLEVEQTLESARGLHLLVLPELAAPEVEDANENEAKRRRFGKARASLQHHNDSQAAATTTTTTSQNGLNNNNFDDDEDLFSDRARAVGLLALGELGLPPLAPLQTTNDDTEQPPAPLAGRQSIERAAYLDWLATLEAAGWLGKQPNEHNESSAAGQMGATNEVPAWSSPAPSSQQRAGGRNGRLKNNAAQAPPPPPSPSSPSPHFAWHLTKLVMHRLASGGAQTASAPLGCFTGLGERYRGNVSLAADGRRCLGWARVRRLLAGQDDEQLEEAQQQQQQRQHKQMADAAERERQREVESGELGPAEREDSVGAQTRELEAQRAHNHCRNPDADPRGPWCFVHAPSTGRLERAHCALPNCAQLLWLYLVAPPVVVLLLLACLAYPAVKLTKRLRQRAFFGHRKHRFSASSIDSNDNSARQPEAGRDRAALKVPEQGNHSDTNTRRPAGLLDLLRGCCASRVAKFVSARPRTSGGGKRSARRRHSRRSTVGVGKDLLDSENLFEICDDLDWSEAGAAQPLGRANSAASNKQLLAHSHSFSPKSIESLRLQKSNSSSSPSSTASPSASSSASSYYLSSGSPATSSAASSPSAGPAPKRPPLAERKPMSNLISGDRCPLMVPMAKCQQATSFQKLADSSGGPMFATLRCHVRGTLQQQQTAAGANCVGAENVRQISSKNNNKIARTNLSSTLSRGDLIIRAKEGINLNRLIPCSASSYSTAANQRPIDHDGEERWPEGERWIFVSELAQLDPNSVSIRHDHQPLFEGKFSQVQVAYLRQQQTDSTQATGLVGAQVAICALKQQATVDSQLFEANRLRLRNLNHLNLLRLLGYYHESAIEEENLVATNRRDGAPCALVYDMAHLVDLKDWLREQSKDFDISKIDSSHLRQNLCCFAKQIALAIDYLHDRNLIYKDLASRNCFLDVTKMLVKLATFNLELGASGAQQNLAAGKNLSTSDHHGQEEIIHGDEANDKQLSDNSLNQILSLKSMIRPKYLLDYYVIDSRPTECQLLPLSWIPLESILFNKFNKQTDIWSFGCLLYELFSLGEAAYFGYSSKQIIDSVRANLMPPQPLLCPNGIYKLMCKCLSDIPTLRPNVKHIYEQLNLYSGQCSSFLDHHLCSLAIAMCNTSGGSSSSGAATSCREAGPAPPSAGPQQRGNR